MSNPQNQQQNRQQNQQQPQQAPRFDGVTYYLVPSEDPDRAMARELLDKSGIKPDRNTRIVTELQVDRLTDQHRVIAMFRKSHLDRNGVVVVTDDEGKQRRTYTAEHKPIQMTEPIEIARFWNPGDYENFVEGGLDTAAFFRVLAKGISPCVLSWHPDREPGVLRTKYA